MIEFVISSSDLTDGLLKSEIAALMESCNDADGCSFAVTPRFLECAAVSVSSKADVSLCSLSLFASQTYTEVAILEVAMALENGADEIEIPMSLGLVDDKNFAEAQSRLEVITEEIGDSAQLSVFIDSSKFSDFDLLGKAVSTAINAGADIIALNVDGNSEAKFIKETLDEVAKYKKSVIIKVTINSNIDSYKADVKNFMAPYSSYKSMLRVRVRL
ncbi:MAG: hypothetical protein RR388_07215 [Rikenellaceae bacterium]